MTAVSRDSACSRVSCTVCGKFRIPLCPDGRNQLLVLLGQRLQLAGLFREGFARLTGFLDRRVPGTLGGGEHLCTAMGLGRLDAELGDPAVQALKLRAGAVLLIDQGALELRAALAHLLQLGRMVCRSRARLLFGRNQTLLERRYLNGHS